MQEKFFKLSEAMFIRNIYINAIKKIAKHIKEEYSAEEFRSMIFKSDQFDRTLDKYGLNYSFSLKTNKLTIFDKSDEISTTIRLLTDEQRLKKIAKKEVENSC